MLHLVSVLGPSLSYIAVGSLVPSTWRFVSRWAAWALYFICIPIVVFRTTYLADVGAALAIAALAFAISCLSAALSTFVQSPSCEGSAKAVLFGYYNIGWFGIPVAQALFGPSGAIIMTSAYIGGVLFGATVGIYLVASIRYRVMQSATKVVQTPACYAFLFGFLAKGRLHLPPDADIVFDAARILLSFLGMALIGSAMRRYAHSMKEIGTLAGLLLRRQLVSLASVSFVLAAAFACSLIGKAEVATLSLIAIFPVAANVIVIAEALRTNAELFIAALVGSTAMAFVLVGVVAICFT
jgi:predicted permease